MVPYPIDKHIPKILKEYMTTKGQAFVDKHNEYLLAWIEELKEMYFLNKLPERVPVQFLSELSALLNAGVLQTDSETTKRKKLYYAISTHKKRGTWEDDAKIRMDNITGYSASIFTVQNSDDSIEMGQIASEDATFYWSTEQGNDGSDDELGTWEVGDFTEYVVAGNIYIDCHEGVTTAVLSASIITQLVTELSSDIVPAYMAVYLGYVNATGQFIVYSGGIIT